MQQFLQKHNLKLTPSQIEQFGKFLQLFIEYNSHTNLSAIRDEQGIIEKHFIDSLMISKFENISGRLLDIGAGWGFPGIPLKILLPELNVILLDSVGKKVNAMNHFVQGLELQNIEAIKERAEVLASDQRFAHQFDFVTSRATAYMPQILEWAKPFLKPTGKIILYKLDNQEELKEGMNAMRKLNLKLQAIHKYELAGQERIFVVVWRK